MAILNTSIFFDVDSTLCTIEGIDELARMKEVEDQIIPLTEKAMNGELTLGEVFAHRLDIIRPRRDDLVILGGLYRQSLSPFVKEVVAELHDRNYQIFIISGGYREAILPLSELLSIPPDHIYANSLYFDERGSYRGFDRTNPLWKEEGKKEILANITNENKKVLVGDGMSDAAAKSVVDLFIGYGGVKERETVKQIAEMYIYDMRELVPILERLTLTN